MMLPVISNSQGADIGNRLTYLDTVDPYYVNGDFPKLITPQWVGDPDVQAVVVLSIDDLRAPENFEKFLRPILNRLKQIDGRAPLSISANRVDPNHPHHQRWLHEGVTLEAHTLHHPCPLLTNGDLPFAKATFNDSIDLLWQVPNLQPVAFRGPCGDIWNTNSPRIYTEIFNSISAEGHFLQISSSVHSVLSRRDPELPRELAIDEDGRDRFLKYTTGEVPIFGHHDYVYVNFVENYPYPYVIDRLCWELPIAIPGDHQHGCYEGVYGRRLVRDWQASVDATFVKRGLMTLCFHPHGRCTPQEVVQVIDHAVRRHGSKVRFLNFREVIERINQNLLGGHPVRADDGGDNGVRLIDLNHDGYLDVVIGNETTRLTRLWDPRTERWQETTFPVAIVRIDAQGKRSSAGVRFGVLQKSGMASLIVRNEQQAGLWHFDGQGWSEVPGGLTGLDFEGQSINTARAGRDRGVRLRDLDRDGLSELLVANPNQNAVFRWSPARARWTPLPFALPSDTRIVDTQGRDAGLRFADVDRDGGSDILFSDEARYCVDRFTSLSSGWAQRILSGEHGAFPGFPPFIRDGRNNGVWTRSGTLWVVNEDTAQLKNHARSVALGELEELEKQHKGLRLLSSWRVLGPFPNVNEKGFDTDFGPETAPGEIDWSRTYSGVGGRKVAWTPVAAETKGNLPAFYLESFCRQHQFRTNDLVVYLATTLQSPANQPAKLWLGSEDGIKVWLNGALVHSKLVRRQAALGQDKVGVDLKEGENRLLIKLEQISAGGVLVAAVFAKDPIKSTAP